MKIQWQAQWQGMKAWWLRVVKIAIVVTLVTSALFWFEWAISTTWTAGTDLHQNFWWWVLGAIVAGLVTVISGVIARRRLKGKKITLRFRLGKWVKGITVVAVVILVYREYGEEMKDFFTPTSSKAYQPYAPAPPYHQGRWNLSADVALPVVAQCESRGRQFDDDGNVVTNKNPNGSIDRGKWQINSDHDREIKKLGIDIMTEEGNERYARILYEKNYLSDWEATRHCWEPKLLALGGQLSNGETTFVVTVGPEWSKVYRYQGSMTVDHRAIGPQKRIAMMTESGVYHFTPEKSDIVPDPVNWARFKSLTDEEENVRVTLSR